MTTALSQNGQIVLPSAASAFNLVEKKCNQLDSLIIQFGVTPAGAQMVAEWKDARIQKGSNGPYQPAPPPVP